MITQPRVAPWVTEFHNDRALKGQKHNTQTNAFAPSGRCSSHTFSPRVSLPLVALPWAECSLPFQGASPQPFPQGVAPFGRFALG